MLSLSHLDHISRLLSKCTKTQKQKAVYAKISIEKKETYNFNHDYFTKIEKRETSIKPFGFIGGKYIVYRHRLMNW